MPELVTARPARRPNLVIRPLGDGGRYVIKDPLSGAFFTFGEQECFLLGQLDGRQDAAAVCQAFQERFGEPLSEEELGEFIDLVRARGFLLPDGATVPRPEEGSPPAPAAPPPAPAARPERAAPAADAPAPPPRPRQSILYWRMSLFDP